MPEPILTKECPDVAFDIYTTITDDIKEYLERGVVDIGVLLEPIDINQYHFLRLPGKENDKNKYLTLLNRCKIIKAP